VVLKRGEDDQCSLFLQTHGKSLEIAGFLGADEKTDLAEKLERFYVRPAAIRRIFRSRHAGLKDSQLGYDGFEKLNFDG